MYRKGGDNKVADALSKRLSSPDQQLYALTSTPQPTWVLLVLDSYDQDLKAVELISQLAINKAAITPFQFKQGLLYYGPRLYVGSSTNMRQHLISLYHDSTLGGHSGVNTTYQRLSKYFYWPGVQFDVLK